MIDNQNDGAISSSQSEKERTDKVLFGCGGCGCLLAFFAFIGGVFMMAMAGDSHMSELGPFGFIVTPLSILIGLISIALLVFGFITKKKK